MHLTVFIYILNDVDMCTAVSPVTECEWTGNVSCYNLAVNVISFLGHRCEFGMFGQETYFRWRRFVSCCF